MSDQVLLKTLEAMVDIDLIETAKECMEHEEYQQDEFTKLVKDIIADNPGPRAELTRKQRNAIQQHLKYHKRCWW